MVRFLSDDHDSADSAESREAPIQFSCPCFTCPPLMLQHCAYLNEMYACLM